MTSSEELALDILWPEEKEFMLSGDRNSFRFQTLARLVQHRARQIEANRMSKRFWPSSTTDLGGYPSVRDKV